MSNILKNLADRLEKGEAGKMIDMDVLEALGDCAHREKERYQVQSDSGFTCVACGKDMYGVFLPKVSTSVDAVSTLQQRILPGASFLVASNPNKCVASVSMGELGEWDTLWIGHAKGCDEATIRLAALLRAKATIDEKVE